MQLLAPDVLPNNLAITPASRLHSRKAPWQAYPMDLLERETHLHELHQAFSDAAAGRGRTVLVTGEAGIGKTSLVIQFTREVQPRARVLWGACEALFTPRPLGPFQDVVHALGGPLLDRMEGDAKPVDLFHGLMESICQHERPSVVVLEDLHWADHATLDFIRFLTRRIDRSQGLAVLTFRDDEIGAEHPLTTVIGELPAHSRVRLKLPALSRATVEQMARASGHAATELYRITGGNPFFVTEVLREGAANAVSSVREAVLSRARHLSEPARELLDVVSVVPDRLELPVLEHMIGQDLDPLDECIDRGLLGLDDGRVSFRHELARLAIENALAAVKRMRMNGRVAQALAHVAGAAPSADMLTRLTHHAIAARDAVAIVRYGPAAAEAATQRGAHREAVTLLNAVLKHAQQLGLRERAMFFEQRAHALMLVADGVESMAMSEAAGALWEALGDDRERAHNLVRRCEIVWNVRPPTFESMDELGDAAIRSLERFGPSDELEQARLWRAVIGVFADREAADGGIARATELVSRSTNPSTRVTALISLTMIEYLSRGAPSASSVEKLMFEARTAGNDPGTMMGHVRMAWLLNRTRDLDGLERCVADGKAFALDRQLDHFLSSHALDQFNAEVLGARGRWDEASALFRQLAERRTLPWFFRLPYCRVPLELLNVRRGLPFDLSEVHTIGERATLRFSVELFAIHRGLMEIAWLTSDNVQAARSLAELTRIADAWQHPWALGEAAFSRRLLDVEGPALDNLPEPYALQFAGDARGAAGAWQRRGYVYEAGLALSVGDEAAQRDAIGVFESLGAKGTAERLRERMRAQGIKGIPQSARTIVPANSVGLTERELEILALLALGRANADIAKHLHRSVRTIEHHVAAIVEKLGANSRQGAVARARSLRILD